MKRLVSIIAVVTVLGFTSAWAEGNGVNNSGVRYIKSPRFARPLIEKWIEEYAKTEPGVEFQIVKGSANKENIDLNVVFDNQDNSTKDFSHVVNFGETAVLPIIARSSEAARLLEGKHLNCQLQLDHFEGCGLVDR